LDVSGHRKLRVLWDRGRFNRNLHERGKVNNSIQELLAGGDDLNSALTTTTAGTKRPTWAQAEGSSLPLGVTWIEEEQSFNFAVHSEHAESVTLLLYASNDLVNPLLTYRFDSLRNKSGQIWHCRIPISEIGDSAYYAIRYRARLFPTFTASTLKRFCSIPTREGCFSPPSSIALWQCEKEQTLAAHPWGC